MQPLCKKKHLNIKLYMKRLLLLISLALLLTSCQKDDLDFDSKADDKLIYPDVDLQLSTWERLDSLTYLSYSDIHFFNENVGIISGFAGKVYITKDAGKTWHTVETHKQMTFHCVYALNENTFFAARHGLFKSTNGGNTWKTCNFPEETTIFDLWFKDYENGFLAGGSATYRTTDGGDNWSKVSNVRASNLQFTSENIGYFTYGSTAISMYASNSLTSSGDIYRTIDGGKTWKKMGLNVEEINSLSFINDKIGYFTTINDAFYKTSDGGESCNLIDNLTMHIYDLFFVNENQGYVCSGNGISVTFDGGISLLEEYSVQGNNLIYKFDFPSPTLGYAIGYNGLIIKRI